MSRGTSLCATQTDIIDRRVEKSSRLFDKADISSSYSSETTLGSLFNFSAEVNGNYTQKSEISERRAGSPEAYPRLLN